MYIQYGLPKSRDIFHNQGDFLLRQRFGQAFFKSSLQYFDNNERLLVIEIFVLYLREKYLGTKVKCLN